MKIKLMLATTITLIGPSVWASNEITAKEGKENITEISEEIKLSNEKMILDSKSINDFENTLRVIAPEKYKRMIQKENNNQGLIDVGIDSSLGTDGDILVTYDNKTSGYNHGHAAIVRNNDSFIVEAIGNSVKFNPNRWKLNNTYYAMYVKGATGKDYINSRNYAELQQGEPYSLTATKNQSSKWYCSLLVYKAWKSIGYDLDVNGGTYVTPHDLVMDNDIKIYASK